MYIFNEHQVNTTRQRNHKPMLHIGFFSRWGGGLQFLFLHEWLHLLVACLTILSIFFEVSGFSTEFGAILEATICFIWFIQFNRRSVKQYNTHRINRANKVPTYIV